MNDNEAMRHDKLATLIDPFKYNILLYGSYLKKCIIGYF